MNSQIAITLLKDLEQSLDDYCELNDEGKTAFSMAITALELFGISEQLPSVQPELSNNSKELENKNGELISRQKAKDAIDMALDHIDHVPSWVYDNLLNALNEVPSVKPTHPTPSNTLGALDCIDRQEAIKALCREECGMDPKGCCVGTCYDVEIIEDVPSVQLELSNNSPELDIKNGELISRQAAIDALDKRFDSVPMEQTTEILMLRKDLRELPSTQPRKGKWIRTRTMTHDGELYCDQCEQEHPEQKIIWNFCPNCGCRMEEGDLDE